MLSRIEVHARALDLLLPARLHPALRPHLRDDEFAAPEAEQGRIRVTLPIRLQRRGGRTEICVSAPDRTRFDPVLIRALREAHAMLRMDAHGLPVLDAAPDSSYTRRLVRRALLAPDLQQAILTGSQSAEWSLTQFLQFAVPLAWSGQRNAF
jgi:hypothetical protein